MGVPRFYNPMPTRRRGNALMYYANKINETFSELQY